MVPDRSVTPTATPNAYPVSTPQTSQVARPGVFARAQSYPAAVELFRQGDQPEDVFYLERGLVKLLRNQADGEERIVGLRSDGWLLGAAAAVMALPFAVTAVTVTAARVARLDAGEFRRRLKDDAGLSWWLHEMHSREVYGQTLHVADLMSISARERLLKFYWRLAPVLETSRAESQVRIENPLRQWEVAQLVGITPQYLCQLMAELEADGDLIRRNGGLILHRRNGSEPVS